MVSNCTTSCGCVPLVTLLLQRNEKRLGELDCFQSSSCKEPVPSGHLRAPVPERTPGGLPVPDSKITDQTHAAVRALPVSGQHYNRLALHKKKEDAKENKDSPNSTFDPEQL